MKKLIPIIALVLLSGCDKVHWEFLWTERHPVPEGVTHHHLFNNYKEMKTTLSKMLLVNTLKKVDS